MIKARTGQGLTLEEYYGAFGKKETTDFELAAIDADKCISFKVSNSSPLKETDYAFIQFAMLYNNIFGEQRIRIFNVNLQVAKNLNEYYKFADVEQLSQFFLKQNIAQSFEKGPKSVREQVLNSLVSLLHNYRINCASKSTPSQLILPDSLKLLPIYVLSTLKTPGLKLLQSTKVDDKIYHISKFLGTPMNLMPYKLYPRVYKITDLCETQDWGFRAEGQDYITKPVCVPASMSSLSQQDAYIIDNGEYIYFYIGC